MLRTIITKPIFNSKLMMNDCVHLKYVHSLEQLEDMDVRENLLSFTMGQRGCTLLVFKGYNYVRNRRSGLKTYWICAKKGSTKCNARVVTNVIDGVQKIVLESCRHNHAQKVARKKRKKSLEQAVQAILNFEDPIKYEQLQLKSGEERRIWRATTPT
ncbi:uncharacterized protein LOC118737284 isoform X1 [Rhagoletis pomonella]|uniref:uncharacterized protein LOC118737284 isoform X1 n=1 Tax=Rhagoletis pomonella TaxID=28610 RepID=UPI00177C81B0|nr:uncharacterized protein LOC118737284 isoform X1 [Rhagoletis pomonella]XP_036323586.1 uncharacterized protein LOC118737284 isoform X1 [Rhagoletis pomonella]